MKLFGGWADFAERLNRLSAIHQRLRELQRMQSAIASEHTRLTEAAAYIRRGLL